MTSYWEPDDIARVGRRPERGRFRKLGSHSAREAALTATGLVRDEFTQEWRAGWLDSHDYLAKSGWGLDHEFDEVPGHLLRADLWSPFLWGKWILRRTFWSWKLGP